MIHYSLVEKSDNGSSFFETRYVYGLGGLIATQRGGQLNFIFKDHLGSTRVVASADGTSGIGYSYDALGNVVQQSAFGNPTSAIAYQYTGQEFDSETQLHNFRARLYDSELFRFYATDPAGEQHSPYAFVGNSPLMFRDPSGKFIVESLVMAGFMALSSGAMAASNGGNFWSAAGRSLLGSAISFGVSAGVGAGLNMAFGTLDPFINTAGDFALRGALQGGLSGAISSAIMGGNALQGGLTGGGMGALGGLGQYGAYEQAYQQWLSEPVSLDGALVMNGGGDPPIRTYYSKGFTVTAREEPFRGGLVPMPSDPIFVGPMIFSPLPQSGAINEAFSPLDFVNTTKMATIPLIGLKSAIQTRKGLWNYKFETQRQALRAAKRDAGIPTSQSHVNHYMEKVDASGTLGTTFVFSNGKTIQLHFNGHPTLNLPKYFNNHPISKNHYFYDR